MPVIQKLHPIKTFEFQTHQKKRIVVQSEYRAGVVSLSTFEPNLILNQADIKDLKDALDQAETWRIKGDTNAESTDTRVP